MSRVNYAFMIFWLAVAAACFGFWLWIARGISQRHHAPELRPRLEANSKLLTPPERALADLIYQLGEERRARKNITGATTSWAGPKRRTSFLAEGTERAPLEIDCQPAGIDLPSTSTQENGKWNRETSFPPALRRQSRNLTAPLRPSTE